MTVIIAYLAVLFEMAVAIYAYHQIPRGTKCTWRNLGRQLIAAPTARKEAP